MTYKGKLARHAWFSLAERAIAKWEKVVTTERGNESISLPAFFRDLRAVVNTQLTFDLTRLEQLKRENQKMEVWLSWPKREI